MYFKSVTKSESESGYRQQKVSNQLTLLPDELYTRWDTQGAGTKTYVTHLVIKYKIREYTTVSYPQSIRPYQ